MILAHTNPALTLAIDEPIGKAPLPLRRSWRRSQRLRSGICIGTAVEAAVGKIREIDDTVVDRPRTATIFMHARACIQRFRDKVLVLALAGANDDKTPLLLRPSLQPVDVSPVEPYLSKADGLGDNEIRGDRRLPGAVGRRFQSSHRGSQSFDVRPSRPSVPLNATVFNHGTLANLPR